MYGHDPIFQAAELNSANNWRLSSAQDKELIMNNFLQTLGSYETSIWSQMLLAEEHLPRTRTYGKCFCLSWVLSLVRPRRFRNIW